jgi:hypothetical protein
MCNAWNHPPNCTCGWGGDGHLGKRTDGNQNINNLRLIDKWSFESYTIPNARCPVCKAFVFFYKSPHGGRVFFDELGPPWPKHPCTDNTKHQYSTPLPSIDINPFWNTRNWSPLEFFKIPDWEKDGWHPIDVQKDTNGSEYAFQLVRISSFRRPVLRIMIYGSFSTEIKDAEFVFVRRSLNNTLSISMFDTNKKDSTLIEIETESNKLDSFFRESTEY